LIWLFIYSPFGILPADGGCIVGWTVAWSQLKTGCPTTCADIKNALTGPAIGGTLAGIAQVQAHVGLGGVSIGWGLISNIEIFGGISGCVPIAKLPWGWSP